MVIQWMVVNEELPAEGMAFVFIHVEWGRWRFEGGEIFQQLPMLPIECTCASWTSPEEKKT